MKSQLFDFSDFGSRLESAGLNLTFVNAPYKCTAEDEAKMYPAVKAAFGHFGEYYEWFNATDDSPPEYRHLPETLDYLERFMEEQGPFDGLVGFSQGGCLVHLISYMQATGMRFTNVPSLKFVLLLSARLSRLPDHQKMWSSPPENLPRSMVIYGGMDTSVKPHETQALIRTLPGADVIFIPEQHHAIPRLSEDDAAKLAEFLETYGA